MEDKRLKQFTFYDLYYEALKGLPDEAAGKMAKNICRFMFTNDEIPEPQDDRENFFWSNIKDVLEEVKRIEEAADGSLKISMKRCRILCLLILTTRR